jgi:hypothetical protein
VLAVRVLQEAGLSPGGKGLATKGGMRAKTNLEAAIRLIKLGMNQELGIERGSRRELTLEEIERALGALEAIGDRVRDRIVERMS